MRVHSKHVLVPPNSQTWLLTFCERAAGSSKIILAVTGVCGGMAGRWVEWGIINPPSGKTAWLQLVNHCVHDSLFNCFVLWADAKGQRLISITCFPPFAPTPPTSQKKKNFPAEVKCSNAEENWECKSKGAVGGYAQSTHRLWDETMGSLSFISWSGCSDGVRGDAFNKGEAKTGDKEMA